jgi:UDP-N-acetylmuramoylalanine--D-glutamate ligase
VEIPDQPFFRGEPLQRNIAAAVAAAVVLGADELSVERGLRAFRGIRDRSELVDTIAGVQFINDTSATAPAAVIAALGAQRGKRVHIIAGGADKRTDLRPLADAIARFATSVALLDGTATPLLKALLDERGKPQLGRFSSMPDAVEACRAVSSDGDVVLLSPGCASFGLFRDEFDRGEQFRLAVAAVRNRNQAG